jgi:Sulfotransferase family
VTEPDLEPTLRSLEAAARPPKGPVRWSQVPGGGWAKRAVRALQRTEIVWSGSVRWAMGRGLMAPPSNLPDFLGIGAAKTGTTWLHHNLRAHPDLYLPDVKEVHYFDSRWHRPPSWYAGHFAAGAGKVKGEITPAYSLLPPKRVEVVRRLVPDARLILLVRDPVETVWSHAVMKLARERGRKPSDVSPEEYQEFFSRPSTRNNVDYTAMIGRWQEEYPPGRLLVASNDEVRERPVELLTQVFTHLGVSVPNDWSGFPAGSVIDRGVGGGADLVGRQRPDSIPEEYRRLLGELYAPETARLHELLEAGARRPDR